MKNIFLLILSIILISNLLKAQDVQWRWSNSPFERSPDANLAHIIGSAYLADLFDDRGLCWWQADLTAFGIGFIWEIKDGIVYDRIIPVFGSEGFSMMDISLNISGIVINRVVNISLNKFITRNKKHNKQLRDSGIIFYY